MDAYERIRDAAIKYRQAPEEQAKAAMDELAYQIARLLAEQKESYEQMGRAVKAH